MFSSSIRSPLLSLLLSGVFIVPGCSDDDTTEPPLAKNKAVLGSQDYSWVDVQINGYPQGSVVALRPDYWSTTELTADPQATVREVSDNVFRVSFANLNAGSFATSGASIRLVVRDSVVDDLSGIVVLCDASGPIDISACAGDCDPLCGLDDCHVCTGSIC